ncbi:MAG: DUF1614 domain-containing protein, partial [Clostridia bacterium]|nr:DUF1614 domain-containing protein [Clostridia bacterium]
WEKWRSIIGVVITAVAVWLLGHYLPNEPETMPFDVNYVYGLAGGVVGYVFGRSRRGAFISGTMGVALADIAQGVINAWSGIDQRLVLGGAGAFDVIVISGLVALLLSELIGEILERVSRGASSGEFERGEKRK